MVARTWSVLLGGGLLVGAAACSGASSSDIPAPASTSLGTNPSPGATSGSAATTPAAAAGNGTAPPGSTPGGTLPPNLSGAAPTANPACVVALNADSPDQA